MESSTVVDFEEMSEMNLDKIVQGGRYNFDYILYQLVVNICAFISDLGMLHFLTHLSFKHNL